ncbi:hypothetical protein AHIS1636_26280 [Arthrobacter mangrovi]|uniref:Uncharacterized protein n=1 Tax=Arthrobacter mangrovi TaxID=2966350 RepID=A0ABQ5MW44_9MICC|nr:hypothetical protein AHIS1636_26280 [Arthrobacter mangrovi]
MISTRLYIVPSALTKATGMLGVGQSTVAPDDPFRAGTLRARRLRRVPAAATAGVVVFHASGAPGAEPG